MPDPVNAPIPHDDLAERAVLEAVMNRPEMLPEVTARLSPEHFHRQRHRLVYEAILSLAADERPHDLVHVVHRLAERQALEQAGGVVAVAELVGSLGVSSLAPEYAKRVLEAWAAREAQRGFGALLGEVHEGSSPGQMVGSIDRLRSHLEAALGGAELKSSTEVGRELLERVSAIYSRVTEACQPTGFVGLDAHLGGFRPGDLVILAARPSMGKTTLALDIAGNVAAAGRAVYVVSLETSADVLQARLGARQATGSTHRILSGQASEGELGRWTDGTIQAQGWPLWFDDSGRATVAKVEAHARRIKAERDLALIVVDYLQLLDAGPGSREETRQLQVARISRELKSLAMVLQVPVLALSQLNRKAEQREGNRPALSDLRDSGSIEQDADVVLLLYREDAYRKKGEDNDGEAEVTIAKHRHGPTGQVTLQFEAWIPRFSEVAA